VVPRLRNQLESPPYLDDLADSRCAIGTTQSDSSTEAAIRLALVGNVTRVDDLVGGDCVCEEDIIVGADVYRL